MIDWNVVAAFCGPLIAVLVALAGFFAWLQRNRDKRVAGQIAEATGKLEANQLLTQQRIDQFERSLAEQAKHLDRQDQALNAAMQAVARIEGRLAGPVQVTTTPALGD